jgi:multidrug efflux pump subunit AcrB
MMLFLGGSAILTTPKDIFPNINIPVVTVIWQYTGLTPEEMEQRVATYSEYSISSNVGDIRNIESQTLSGIAVEKIFFQPNVNIDLAISQIVSASNAIRALMPAGIQPPVIVQYAAGSFRRSRTLKSTFCSIRSPTGALRSPRTARWHGFVFSAIGPSGAA